MELRRLPMLPGSQMLSTENLARYLQSTWVWKLRSSGPACDPSQARHKAAVFFDKAWLIK